MSKAFLAVLQFFFTFSLIGARGRSLSEVHIAINTSKLNLRPTEHIGFFDSAIGDVLFETLVRYDKGNRLMGSIASKWSIDESGTVYNFNINSNKKFSDGSTITSRDVVWGLASHIWPSSDSVFKRYLQLLVVGGHGCLEGCIPDGLKVIDSTRFTIKLRKPYFRFLKILADPSLSIYKLRENSEVIGSGPMKVKNHVPPALIHIERNSNYQGFKVVKNDSIYLHLKQQVPFPNSMLKSGKLDAFIGIPIGYDLEQPSGYRKFYRPVFNTIGLVFNKNTAINNNFIFRKDLSGLIKGLAKSCKSSTHLVESQQLLPAGIMPLSYYLGRNKTFMAVEPFLQKWGAELSNVDFSVLIAKHNIDSGLVQCLEAATQPLPGFKILQITGRDYILRRKRMNADLNMILYKGDFFDPDGFIFPFSERLPEFDRTFKTLVKYMHSSKDEIRLKTYEANVRAYENSNWVIPLHSTRITVLHNDRLSPQSSKFRSFFLGLDI